MTEKKFQIAGSILSADLINLERDVGEALECGVDVIHFDVMDYHFVPNMTFGPGFLAALKKKYPEAVFDVHLMVEPVTEAIVSDYIKAGADWVSFHPEACTHVERMLTFIQDHKVKAGLALNPATAPQLLDYLWDKLDFVLVMTVNPGFGGQKVLNSCLKKVTDVKCMAFEAGAEILIEVDGGVKAQNIGNIAECGANVFVVGSAFFGAENKAEALKGLHEGLKI
jgi:ribulose-phosphate 3-epimerase